MVSFRRGCIVMKSALPALVLALAGCLQLQVQEPRGPALPPDVEIFGTGDTLAYVHDTARFAVSLAPPIEDVESYVWKVRRSGSDSVLDSVATPGPALARVWTKAGLHSIGVEARTTADYWMPPFAFSIRVDSGLAVIALDTTSQYPFGSGNRFRVQARDPDGSVVKYHWSTRPDRFMDSTDVPEWSLPDTLLDYADVYCRVRDDKGFFSATARKSLRFLPKGVHGALQDDFRGLVVLPDGGFLAVGRTRSFDSRLGEPWVARLDGMGALEAWSTLKRSGEFGVFGSGEFHAIAAGAGGDYIAVGAYRDSTHDDALIAGVDAAGSLRWRIFVGDSGHQVFRAGVQADGGRHVAVGSTVPDARKTDSTEALVAVVSPAGGLLHAKAFRKGKRLDFRCVARAADGNLVVGAMGPTVTAGAEGWAGHLYKLTPDGDSLWARPIDRPVAGWLQPHSLAACRGGGFALLSLGYGHSVLQRLDEDGKTVWARTLSAVPEEWARSGSLAESPEGDLLVGIDLPHSARPPGILLAKLDAAGNLLWSRQLARADDVLHAVAALPTGGFAAAGSINRQGPTLPYTAAWIFRFDPEGKMLW